MRDKNKCVVSIIIWLSISISMQKLLYVYVKNECLIMQYYVELKKFACDHILVDRPPSDDNIVLCGEIFLCDENTDDTLCVFI